MVLESLRERVEKKAQELKESAKEKKDAAISTTKEVVHSSIDNLKDSASTAYNKSNEIITEKKAEFYEAIPLRDLWNSRNAFIKENSLAYRINLTLGLNVPVFLFSKGLRRIRNPVLFSAITSVLILPELVNPFNRR